MSSPVRPGRFVSTGVLPAATHVEDLIASAREEFAAVSEGQLSSVYPALAAADPDQFGIALATVEGVVHQVGDAGVAVTLMSVSKPFAFALACADRGIDEVRRVIGVNATGMPFNSIEAVARAEGGRTNPMVNSGAISTTSLAPGATDEDRWAWLRDGLGRFAGHPLDLDETTLASARETNFRNRGIATLVRDAGGLAGDPLEAVDLYTRQCCLLVSCVDLAVMGATLADGGVNPVTGEQVVSADVARATLAVMSIAGMYETSGDWLLDVGVPAKSGISGGLMAVSPGKGGLGVFSPLLDGAGNSVRGQLVARRLAADLGLDLLGSASEPRS
ncbi:MAG: glutaminase A [Propionicimonas sp.]|uniref:glutaminase A n=1 Tax=Propionicimonas sp. TaxID=1955623 RepID=UPI003D11A375